MRQLIKIFLIFLLVFAVNLPANCAINGKIEYKIPIDYSKLDETELESKAGIYFNAALNTSTGAVNEEVTTALNLYSILSNKNPENVIYPTRLGILYDLIKQDKYAKGNFYKALAIQKNAPEPYFYLGEFYYKRSEYKKALKMYKSAYVNGYNRNYETLYKIGDIYEKFGDTEASIRYLKLALEISPNSNLELKIQKVESAHNINKEYYSNTRIRLIER